MHNLTHPPILDGHGFHAHCSRNVRLPSGLGVVGDSDCNKAMGEEALDLSVCQANTPKIALSGAAAELFDLQVAQFKHDELYHREIARLTVHGRLNHMALHFCKYVGQFAEAILCGESQNIQRTIVDTFIINLCASNALNIRLSNRMSNVDASSLAQLSHKLHNDFVSKCSSRQEFFHWLLPAFAAEAGRVARACEKIDHLEAFPFRESIASTLGTIASLCLAASTGFETSLAYEVRKRLLEVEEKFLFHNVLQSL